MYNATLLYKINYNNQDKYLRLENKSLYMIDKITSNYKNEDDFINNYQNREEIDKFIKENGNIKGDLVINYTKNVNDRTELFPIYNSNESIFLEDDFYNNQISEIEKTRKLLFNSKNQLFVKLLLSSKEFDNELNKVIDLNEDEIKFAKNNNLELCSYNNKTYINFKTLLKYRANTSKLGLLREVYQDMLNVLKERIMNLDRNVFYYYSRQLRILIDKYKEMTCTIGIKNLKIHIIKNNNYILVENK